MVMHITNDLWLNFKLAERAVDRVPGAQLIAEESPVAHYGVFSIVNHRKNDPKFVAFMDDVASLDRAQQFVDKNYRVPGVAANIDPKKSFWKDFVTYPYPVKYATAKDSRGTSWQIGYMDEYAGTDRNPKVLVIIHGKGAFGGHYGNIMQYALRSGLRVIVPDLPHYGMSGPVISTRARRAPCRTCAKSCMISWSTSSGSKKQSIWATRSAANWSSVTP
jgi:homoserine O-acetyltransferase